MWPLLTRYTCSRVDGGRGTPLGPGCFVWGYLPVHFDWDAFQIGAIWACMMLARICSILISPSCATACFAYSAEQRGARRAGADCARGGGPRAYSSEHEASGRCLLCGDILRAGPAAARPGGARNHRGAPHPHSYVLLTLVCFERSRVLY